MGEFTLQSYEPDFPIVAIESAQPGRMATGAELNEAGLVAPPEPPREAPARRSGGARRWPDYQYCLDRAPLAHGEDRADVSRADFAWCMTAIDWGFGIEETAARLMEESAKAQENGHNYALITARNAAAAVERRGTRAPEP